MWNENSAFFLGMQTNVPTLGVGDPGVAKTRTTEAFARAVKRHYECVVGSHAEPADLTGYPHISEVYGEKCLSLARTEWLINLENSPNGGILHLDELTDCAPAIQAAMLQLLTHGIKNTWICATANPGSSGTNAYDLAPTTVNRLCVLNWKTPVTSWARGMLTNFENHVEQFPILPKGWEDGMFAFRNLIVSFCTKAHPETLQQLPKNVADRGAPWPSLRSWTNAATLLTACEAIGGSEDIAFELLQGCVGNGCAIAFSTWRKALDLPDPEELLSDPGKFKPSARGDIAHVVLNSVVAAVLRQNTLQRWNAAWELVSIQCETAPDIAATASPPLTRNLPEPDARTPEKIRRKLLAVLQ